MFSGQHYQSYSSLVDERLYRDPTDDDIVRDVTSQSYGKTRRRYFDLYELVIFVWEILVVISGYIQVRRDLTPASPTNDERVILFLGQRHVTDLLPVPSHCTAVVNV